MAKVSAIILGAGLSRRMGKENKLFLPIDGKPMIEWVIERVVASSATEIILVGSALSMGLLKKYEGMGIKLVENLHYQSGMTSSIQEGLTTASGDGYMICLGDQPAIMTSTYNSLIESFHNKPTSVVLPFFEGKKGNPVIFPKAIRGEILNHTEPEGCKQIIHENQHQVLKVKTEDPGILMDVDTRADYESQIK